MVAFSELRFQDLDLPGGSDDRVALREASGWVSD